MDEKSTNRNDSVKKIVREKLLEDRMEEMSAEEAYERQYYENSIIIKVRESDKLIDDIATCFSIEDTMELLMLAPLEFMSRTDGIEGEKEFKEKLWKQVRNFYVAAREILDKRYRL